MVTEPPIEATVREANRVSRAEVAALAAELRAGGDAVWDAPSYCKGWAVKDAVIHTVRAVLLLGGGIRATLSGQPANFDPAQAQALDAQLAAQPREMVVAELERAHGDFADYVDGIDVAALPFPVQLPFGTFPVWQMVVVVLNEIAIHHWDMRAGLDPGAQVNSEAVPILVSMAIQSVPLLAHGEKRDGTWQLDVDAPTGGPLVLKVAGDKATMEPGSAASPVARLAMDGEAFVLLLWGRLDLAKAIDSGRVRVDGDRGRALALQPLFPGG
jgi:uncharacterized protein (TIGR03083 family)